jgi:hypothetical protein
LLLGASTGLGNSPSHSIAKYKKNVYATIRVCTIVGLPLPTMGFSNIDLTSFLKHKKNSCENKFSRMVFLVLSSTSRFLTYFQQDQSDGEIIKGFVDL